VVAAVQTTRLHPGEFRWLCDRLYCDITRSMEKLGHLHARGSLTVFYSGIIASRTSCAGHAVARDVEVALVQS
jgi:hypothetical protein